MTNKLNRRRFLKGSIVASSVAGAAVSFEERALLARASEIPAPAPAKTGQFPTGRIGKVSMSRLICGGNLLAGFAHSRDLIYVSALMKQYFTDDKIFETFQQCEAQGINTAILRLDPLTLHILSTYRKERGGKIQWLAQIEISEKELATQIKQAVDNGAIGAFTHGGIGDDLVQKGRVDVLAKAIELIRKEGVISGVAGHSLEVPKACEKAGVNPDFYMKTFNSKRYWSAGPMPRHDSVWEETPEDTRAFMQEVEKPWIAYKVLGAGAIHPREGFQYAFQNGADFLCVGMFDFQIGENAELGRLALEKAKGRERQWFA
jgi:hypothetical protein